MRTVIVMLSLIHCLNCGKVTEQLSKSRSLSLDLSITTHLTDQRSKIFKYIKLNKTFTQSVRHCRQLRNDRTNGFDCQLARFRSKHDAITIVRNIERHLTKKEWRQNRAWIGAYVVLGNQVNYINGNQLINQTRLFAWDEGEPRRCNRSCCAILINQINITWRVASCHEQYPFLCECGNYTSGQINYDQNKYKRSLLPEELVAPQSGHTPFMIASVVLSMLIAVLLMLTGRVVGCVCLRYYSFVK